MKIEVPKFYRKRKSKLGSIDYLVLNHIIPIPLGLWEGTSQNLTLASTVIDVNFKAYVHMASHALPHLQKSHGSIVVVSSLSGEILRPTFAWDNILKLVYKNLRRIVVVIIVVRWAIKSSAHMISYALPHLWKSHGSIVVVSSLSGDLLRPTITCHRMLYLIL